MVNAYNRSFCDHLDKHAPTKTKKCVMKNSYYGIEDTGNLTGTRRKYERIWRADTDNDDIDYTVTAELNKNNMHLTSITILQTNPFRMLK